MSYEFCISVGERHKHKCLWVIQLALGSQGDDHLIQAGWDHTQGVHEERVK